MTAVKQSTMAAICCEVTTLHEDLFTGKFIGVKLRDTLPSFSSSQSSPIQAEGITNATGPSPTRSSHRTTTTTSPSFTLLLGCTLRYPTTILLSPWVPLLPTEELSSSSNDRAAPSLGRLILPVVSSRIQRHRKRACWVLDEVRSYPSPNIKVRHGDVLSARSGLRLLVKDPIVSPKHPLDPLVRMPRHSARAVY